MPSLTAVQRAAYTRHCARCRHALPHQSNEQTVYLPVQDKASGEQTTLILPALCVACQRQFKAWWAQERGSLKEWKG